MVKILDKIFKTQEINSNTEDEKNNTVSIDLSIIEEVRNLSENQDTDYNIKLTALEKEILTVQSVIDNKSNNS